MTENRNPAGQTDLTRLEESLGYRFSNPQLLLEAVTHSTYAYEQRQPDIIDNERLEFLGDAVLDLIISHRLYLESARLAEGVMTKARALVVCEPTLAKAARSIGLGDYLRLGRGEESTGGRDKASNLSNAVEAIIGAAFQDGGLSMADGIVCTLLAEELKRALSGRLVYDYKSRLIELVQGSLPSSTLRFAIIREEGPVHERTFTACALLDEHPLGEGIGSSKKEAEQHAAREALQVLNSGNAAAGPAKAAAASSANGSVSGSSGGASSAL